ncbi:MAG: glycosyltransferase family 4 protein [Acidimicrobiales bacterium]
MSTSAPGSLAASLAVSVDVSAIPEQPGGVGRYTTALVTTLGRRNDLELTLMARASDMERWSLVAPRARVMGVAPDPRPIRLIWEQARLPHVLANVAVAVHHSPHYTMPEVASLPRVVTVHDLTMFDHPEWHERSKAVFFRRAVRVASAHADVVICVSKATAMRLATWCEPVGEVVVVPHGVDHARFQPAGDSGAGTAALEALGVRQPYVGFLGTVEPRKDVPTLVRAFDKMCLAHPGLSLVIAGTPAWGEADLAKAISESRHADRILRLGYVDEAAIPELLRHSAAIAYPALEEGFGLPVLEALACGAPLVTTSSTVMEELADGAALLVKPGDADGLAGALDMLVRRDAGLDFRRERGLAVAARYTWAASASGHIEAYRAAVGHWEAAGGSPVSPESRPVRGRLRAGD